MVKRALLVGINYYGSRCQLQGCIHDVHNMKTYLEHHGYTVFRVLTDDHKHDHSETDLHPTRANILASLEWLVNGAQEGDSLFLHYSGHGTQTLDRDGDEADGMDEALCPVDWSTAGLITDDELRARLVNASGGAQVVFVADCCHSGTMLDMRFNFVQRRGNELVLREEAQYAPRDNTVVCISGCKDKQTSADTTAVNPTTGKRQAQGALSWVLLEVLSEEPQLSFKDMMQRVWSRLRARGYDQVPQLSCSRLLDLNAPVCI